MDINFGVDRGPFVSLSFITKQTIFLYFCVNRA